MQAKGQSVRGLRFKGRRLRRQELLAGRGNAPEPVQTAVDPVPAQAPATVELAEIREEPVAVRVHHGKSGEVDVDLPAECLELC